MLKKILTLGIIILCLGIWNLTASSYLVKKNDNTSTIILNDQPLNELFQPGDILIYQFKNPKLPHRVGHCRILKEYNPNTQKYTIIEAIDTVLISSISEHEILNFAPAFYYEKIYIVKVNANETQKNNALAFAKQQLGKKFDLHYKYINKNHNPDDPNDLNSNEWYCSELIWAAYYNCNGTIGEGIDIDYNGWEKDSRDIFGRKYSFVAPLDIIKDDDVQVFTIWEKEYPRWIYFLQMIINFLKK